MEDFFSLLFQKKFEMEDFFLKWKTNENFLFNIPFLKNWGTIIQIFSKIMDIFIEFHIKSETEYKSGCNQYPDTKLTTPAYISCNNFIITLCFKERMATRMSTLKTKGRMKMVARTLSLVTCKGAVSGQQLLTLSLDIIFLEIWKKVTINSTF